jgi:hypothetical protein
VTLLLNGIFLILFLFLLSFLLQAFNDLVLSGKNNDWGLVLVGDGPQEDDIICFIKEKSMVFLLQIEKKLIHMSIGVTVIESRDLKTTGFST